MSDGSEDLLDVDSIAIGDRVVGVLLGLAAGDLNGGPIRMAVRLAESLSERGTFDADDVLARYLDWYQKGAFDTGPVAEKVFARIVAGDQVDIAVRFVHKERGGFTAGCNPAHRSPPLAMAHYLADDKLPRAVLQEAALTHFESQAGDVAAGVVMLCRHLIVGAEWQDALAAAACGRRKLTQRALGVIKRGSLDRGGYAPDVLAAAIHFLDSHDSLGDALEASFTFAGRSNYCPVLVGAIGGARWGAGAVPVERIQHAELLPRVCAAAKHLAAAW
jgi:ADP-ribosylglycohydrolase